MSDCDFLSRGGGYVNSNSHHGDALEPLAKQKKLSAALIGRDLGHAFEGVIGPSLSSVGDTG